MAKALRWVLAAELAALFFAFAPSTLLFLLSIAEGQAPVQLSNVVAGIFFLACLGSIFFRGIDYLLGSRLFYMSAREPVWLLSIRANHGGCRATKEKRLALAT